MITDSGNAKVSKGLVLSLLAVIGVSLASCSADSDSAQIDSTQASATATDVDSNKRQTTQGESSDSAIKAGGKGDLGVGTSIAEKMPNPPHGESPDIKAADSPGQKPKSTDVPAKEKLPGQWSGLTGQQSASDSQIGGTCGTIYGQPVVAGSSTSCGFAMEVAMLATAGTHPVASWPVTATSRETGKTYTMSCGIAGPADSVWCVDMNGTAEVRVGPGEYGSWNHLVD